MEPCRTNPQPRTIISTLVSGVGGPPASPAVPMPLIGRLSSSQ